MDKSNFPQNLHYSKEHIWITPTAPYKLGISDYAQTALNDLTYAELPKVGDKLEADEEFGTLESTKSVSPLFMPIAGTITAINEALLDAPELINQDPYGEGWIVEITPATAEFSSLLNAQAYAQFLEQL